MLGHIFVIRIVRLVVERVRVYRVAICIDESGHSHLRDKLKFELKSKRKRRKNIEFAPKQNDSKMSTLPKNLTVKS